MCGRAPEFADAASPRQPGVRTRLAPLERPPRSDDDVLECSERTPMDDKIKKTDEAWRAELDPTAYDVLRQKGTEGAFTGKYWDCHDAGTYVCAACQNELFSSDTKFESGTGWPSFYEP